MKVSQSPSLAAPSPEFSQRHAMEQDESREGKAEPTPQWPESSSAICLNADPSPRYYSRNQLVILGLSFVMTAAASGFFGFIAGKKIAESHHIPGHMDTARRPVAADLAGEASQAQAKRGDTATQTGAVQEPSKPETTAALPALKAAGATARNGAPAAASVKKNSKVGAVQVARSDTSEAKPAMITAPKKDPSGNIWSVQISATQDQSAAQLLQDKLKSKGIDAFIVEAELNSTRWYRVRVGRYATSQEAEKIRQELQSREKLASAFVTGE